MRRATLSEAMRVAKPGGKIVIVDYHRPVRWHPLRLLMTGVFRKLEPYAMDLWDNELAAFMPAHTTFRFDRKTNLLRRALPEAGSDPLKAIMETFKADVAIVGAGGAGLRAAIAVAEADPTLSIALISKVYPMRSHTVAAEGGAAAVTQAHDSLEAHFHDTVAGGDWLCEQDVVQFFVGQAHEEMVQMEHWGCPWSRKADGHANVRAFGGMKIERTWFAADKTGFHMLHTLFQTSIKYPSIRRFDEHFCMDLVVEEGRVQGVVAIEIATGEFRLIQAKSVIIATGGAGRVFRENTNGGIVTGDGMALAYRHGVPLRDMEFVQYHPTCMPGTGLLFTEACRGEGGFMLNKDGYRYLQDYGLGPASPTPVNKAMELGPRDRLSQAYWHEKQKGRTVKGPHGDVVHLDLRHLGEKKLRERLPQIYELAVEYLGVDPAKEPIPVLPAVHYTMGGITADGATASTAARPVLGGRMLERRHPWREPAGLEFADGAAGVRQGGRHRSRGLCQEPAARQHRQDRQAGRGSPPPGDRPSSRARTERRRLPPCARRWPRAWKTAAASIARLPPCSRPATSWPN